MQTEVDDSVKFEAAVDLKGSVFTLPVLQICSASIEAIELELTERLSAALKFFKHAPVVIDLEKLAGQALDFSALLQMLARQDLVSVGVKNGTAQQNALAVSAGLAILKGGPLQNIMSDTNVAVQKATANKSAEKNTSSNTDSNRENNIVNHSVPAKIVTQPVRSGQQIYARGGDLIVMAAVNPGAEIVADGNIHVYAPMKGRALAGVLGDTKARIFCQSMQAELIAIAGNFRVFEDQMPDDIRSKSVQAFLDGDHLVVTPL
ncbi:MAG: septum site-determining protein MinC [Gammaproteobacteria bacterium]|nr:septum site-determining protein MinC [Gammaproteobacteria bacterium]